MMDDPDSSSRLEEVLVKKLTIGETYFFRDRNLFLLLKERLLPNLIQERRNSGKNIRIWCAACSTGEEPYSVAILLHYLLPDIQEWDITILGTDINSGSLHAAERGIYSKWSFREQAPVQTDSYFSPGIDGRVHLSSKIREMVTFSRLNLITDCYPSSLSNTTGMDIILCRNVLMYFDPDLAASVVDRLNSSLITGGWLMVSPQEISYAQRPGFIQIKKSSVFLFQKGSGEGEVMGDITHFQVPSPSYSVSPDYSPLIPENFSSGTAGSEMIPPDSSPLKGVEWLIHEPPTYPDAISLEPPSVETPDSLSSEQHIQNENPTTLILAGRLAEAEYLLLQNKSPGSESFGEMEMIARAFADQGDTQRAMGWCDRILAADPLRPGAYHLRAVIQQDNGESSSAVQSLKQALYADPDYIPAHLMLGMLMKTQGRHADSNRHYLIALKILSAMSDDTPIEETDGMPAGRVREMIRVLLDGGNGS